MILTYFFVCCQYVLVDPPSCQALATVTLQLLQFQEDAFGRQAADPALTKLPVSFSVFVLCTCSWDLHHREVL